MKYFLLVFETMRRNWLRTTLTSLGTMVMVFVVTLVLSILTFLDRATSEKSQNLKAIVSERWQIPSQMPFAYADALSEGAPQKEGDHRVEPQDSMTWSFYGGSTEKDLRLATRESFLFAFALKPSSLLSMMDELDSLEGQQKTEFEEVVKKLEENRRGIVVGKDRLAALERNVGDTITLYGLNYKGIDLELQIVGLFPPGRYDNSAAINRDYLTAALDAYPQSHSGKPHPLASKSLNLVWLRLKDKALFEKVSNQVLSSPSFSSPAVKVETASSGISTFLEAYRDLIWGMRWLLAPAILVTLSLVISNAISISVRERRMEFAVLKVLGFRPWQILTLVMSEALAVGILSGVFSAGLTYYIVNVYYGGLKFPIAFFGEFRIPREAWWWGAAIGGGTAFAGSFLPAWSARTVKVSDVFAKIA
jgi:putative ABC transport system permease protein